MLNLDVIICRGPHLTRAYSVQSSSCTRVVCNILGSACLVWHIMTFVGGKRQFPMFDFGTLTFLTSRLSVFCTRKRMPAYIWEFILCGRLTGCAPILNGLLMSIHFKLLSLMCLSVLWLRGWLKKISLIWHPETVFLVGDNHRLETSVMDITWFTFYHSPNWIEM